MEPHGNKGGQKSLSAEVKRCIKWYRPPPIDQNEPLRNECVHTTEQVESHGETQLLETLKDATASVSKILNTPWTDQLEHQLVSDTRHGRRCVQQRTVSFARTACAHILPTS